MIKFPQKHLVKMGLDGAAYLIPFEGRLLKAIASNGMNWEHASVSLPNRCPNWREMCFVKDFFWDEEDLVVQYHPPKSQYVNMHVHCLHLWRPIEQQIPAPLSILVGFK